MFLRRSTQIVVAVGPFLDASDGVTPETGVTLSGADEAEALKAAGAATTDISSATWTAITGSDGWYHLTLTTSHTDTVGEMEIVVHDDDVCLPVRKRYWVLNENIFDALFDADANGFASTGRVSADLVAVNGDTTPILNLQASLDTVVRATIDDTVLSPTTTQFDTDLTEATADHYKDRACIFESGALQGQAKTITGYSLVGGRGRFTTRAFTEAPANGDIFVVE